MGFGIQLVLVYFFALVMLLIALYVMIPALTGLPWVPTKESRIRRALEMAQVQPGEIFYDLGAGDGRVLIAAARDFGARGVGIEISPLHCWQARVRIAFAGLKGRVSIRQGNFFKADISDADVVFLYIISTQSEKVGRLLESQLKPGARVVSNSVDIRGWQPVDMDKKQLIFLYRMPPERGGVDTYLMTQP